MAKRKPHNKTARLRRALKGSRIIFDGNEQNMLDYRQPNGLPMTRSLLYFITDNKWRWKLTLGLICRMNGATRVPSEELIVEQACGINDLTEFVKERHEIMALEQPAAWKVEAAIWEVEVMG